MSLLWISIMKILGEGIEKDGLYALPYESVPNLMFVNKTLLQQMEIEAPDSDWS